MNWLNQIVDELIARHPDGEIVVSSGVSPSGKYHLGTLREVLTAEVIARELERRGRQSRHIHVVDDHDVFRKVPSGISEEFEKHLGKPLFEVPAPDGSNRSYADYFLADLLSVSDKMDLRMEIVRSQQNYERGMFTEAIERTLDKISVVRRIIEQVSGRKIDQQWSPIQVNEEGYLKNRPFQSIDTDKKAIRYLDKDGNSQEIDYSKGDVKLNWRIDWPARWWLLGVDAEPFGRDHATKGGSYDTGKEIVKEVFGVDAPLPIPYDFINRTGDTKKMSKSAGDTITATELLEMLPAEIVWYFILRSSPDKLLFFDEGPTLMRLVDEFSALLAKDDKMDEEKHLIELCMYGVDERTVSNIPFSHLVASYQASLKDADKTLEVIKRTEHSKAAEEDAEIIKAELKFIDAWLQKRAPEEVKFELLEQVNQDDFTEDEKKFLRTLGDRVAEAPADADGAWFHNCVYELKDRTGLQPKDMFTTLYRALIGKTSGPRAGYFLSILPRDWLVKRLRFAK
jgi:lysyl-tRNA synthetase class 1